MTSKTKYKIIAFFLLMVFSLNTLAGFACSIGIDMGYNSKHHEHETHDLKPHKHHSGHQHAHVHHYVAGLNVKAPNDDCCSGQVSSFAQLDKAVACNNLLLSAPVFLLSLASIFLTYKITEPDVLVNSRFQFVRRSCSLNDTDIRIAIQSFQI